MGRDVSHDQPDVAPELGAPDAVFRLPGRHSQGDLYHQRGGVAEHVAAQGDQDAGLVSELQEAALKLLFLALEHIAKKWTMPVQNWKAALQRFAILLGDRVPKAEVA